MAMQTRFSGWTLARLYLPMLLVGLFARAVTLPGTASAQMRLSTPLAGALSSELLITASSETSKILLTVPVEKIAKLAVVRHAGDARVTVFRLSMERGLEIEIKCRGCPGHERVSRGIHGGRQLLGELLPIRSTLVITATRAGENGRYLELVDAGGRNEHRRTPELCLLPMGLVPMTCGQVEAKERGEQRAVEQAQAAVVEAARRQKEAEEAAVEARTEREVGEREAERRQEARESLEGVKRAETELREREANEKVVITSVDNTKGDVAPYEGEFEVADQPFVASTDRITYAGVTIANPNVAVGPSTDKVTLKLCVTPECTGTVLASAEALVNNYGLTSVEFHPEVTVTEGSTYYLVWTPPADRHDASWLAFWHGGGHEVADSQDMEAVVRGYDHSEGSGYPFKGETPSYLETQAPPAPHVGTFSDAYQRFEAVSNRITTLGVVVGNQKLERGEVGPEKIRINLCTTPKCENGTVASAETDIVNNGITEARVPTATVLPGVTYFVSWEAPAAFEGEAWEAFWFGNGSTPRESDAIEAFAKGYDEGSVVRVPTYFTEQPEEATAIETFKNYIDATERGPDIRPMESVEVSCKIFAPEIEWSEPEGYWYRIHSAPWNEQYYVAANEFLNTTGGESIPADPDVPDC
jgi:hypothetical protein